MVPLEQTSPSELVDLEPVCTRRFKIDQSLRGALKLVVPLASAPRRSWSIFVYGRVRARRTRRTVYDRVRRTELGTSPVVQVLQQCGTPAVCTCARLRAMYDAGPYVTFTVGVWLATVVLRHARRWCTGRSLRSAVRTTAAHAWWCWCQVVTQAHHLVHPYRAHRARVLHAQAQANADVRFFRSLNQAARGDVRVRAGRPGRGIARRPGQAGHA